MTSPLTPTGPDLDLPDSDALTAAVFAVDAVTDIYPPAPTFTQAPQLVHAILTGTPEKVNRVQISSTNEQLVITARVGAHRTTPAPQTAARVADTVLALIPEGRPVAVHIQISRIA